MSERKTLQEENLSPDKVLDFLTYFLGFRKMRNRALAEKIGYSEIYLINVRKGRKNGTEKLLHALESFFQLDCLKQIRDIDRQIEDLKREKLVLQEQTIEKFYAERATAGKSAAELARLNEAPPPKPIHHPVEAKRILKTRRPEPPGDEQQIGG